MSNLLQCTRCNKVLVTEEYNNHRCVPQIKRWKTIKFANYFILKDKHGKTSISIRSLDGTQYDFEEVPESKEYTKKPYQPKVNTNNTTDKETEPTLRFCKLYSTSLDKLSLSTIGS